MSTTLNFDISRTLFLFTAWRYEEYLKSYSYVWTGTLYRVSLHVRFKYLTVFLLHVWYLPVRAKGLMFYQFFVPQLSWPMLIPAHWWFHLSFWLLSVLILPQLSSFMPLINFSFSLLSFSLYPHSFAFILWWPTNSFEFSFCFLINLQYCNDKIISLC